MAIHYVPLDSSRRLLRVFPTQLRRANESFLIPFRLLMWVVHFTALILASRGSRRMIVESSLARGYRQDDHAFLRLATDMCLAASFFCLFFNAIGIVTGRTLRFGLSNFFQGGCDGAAAVLLIVAWHAVAHVARVWHVFYIFSIIPTGFEMCTLLLSYRRGVDSYR